MTKLVLLLTTVPNNRKPFPSLLIFRGDSVSNGFNIKKMETVSPGTPVNSNFPSFPGSTRHWSN
jgi:hypothetical protein